MWRRSCRQKPILLNALDHAGWAMAPDAECWASGRLKERHTQARRDDKIKTNQDHPSGYLFQCKKGPMCLSPTLICGHSAWGRFRTARAQRGHSARTTPIITVIIQVTTLKTTHLRNHAQSIQNSKIQTSDACHGSHGPKFCLL